MGNAHHMAKGVTVHNTADVKVAAGTNAAEQYTRATYNGNMSGVVVHFYVWDNEIWQNLREDERGWHAADGSTRRKSQRKDGSTIGGNLDTIAIECIGNRKLSEDTTAKLVAWLCKKHGLDPKTDIYTHKYFYSKKNCPVYILPHWNTFLSNGKSTITLSPAKPSRQNLKPLAECTRSNTATRCGKSPRHTSVKEADTPKS